MTDHAISVPARTRRQAKRMKLINGPMRRVLGLPFATPLSRRLMVVTHIGRRTGRVYHQPVSYTRDGDSLLTPGGGHWTDNLINAQPVDLRVAGRHVVASPELVRDPKEVDRLLRQMVAVNRRLAAFVPFVERDGTIDMAKLVNAVGYGFCVVRWHFLDRGAS